MDTIKETLLRNLLWISIAVAALILLSPGKAEFNTLLLISLTESIAIGFSGAAVYAYTKLDFTRAYLSNSLGFIFLGVHICVGLAVLGVYIAQLGA